MTPDTGTMRKALPATYWTFRRSVTLVQLAAIAALFAAGVLWTVTDGNGARTWDAYYHFSLTFSQWANANFRFPWGG